MRRSLQLALFGTAITWVVAASMLASRAARGITIRFALTDCYFLLDAIFLVFLLGLGFQMLEGIVRRRASLVETVGLPERASAKRELATGVAIGWSVVVLAVLPMALGRTLHVRLWGEPRAFWLVGVNLAAAAIAALASEMAFRGYPYRRLIEAIGPSWATVAMALVYGATGGLAGVATENATVLSTGIAVLLGVLLAVGWLRTHGLWIGWGIHFAWMAGLGVLFGLPVNGVDNLSSVVQTRAVGGHWLTGGVFGPEGAFFTLVVLVGAIVVLVKATSDWAWEYTRKPIVAAGIAMDVAPPAAHTAMEEQAAKAPALVQILPVTPQERSVVDRPLP